MGKYTKWLPVLMPVLTLVVGAFSGTVQNFWSNHGDVAVIVGSLTTILASFLPQPHKD